jgi:hypothetical protein
MQTKFNKILEETVEIIQAYSYTNIEEVKKHSESLKQLYSMLESDCLINSFYKELEEEFQDDPKLYILLLSILYDVNMDESSMTEALEVLKKNELDLFLALYIRTQIETRIFVNFNIKRNYILRREVHRKLLLKLNQSLNIQKEYIPLKERDPERIVIVTNQLLSDLHAPTSITKELCYILQKKLNKKVLLIVAPEAINYEQMQQIWINPQIMNYTKEYNGNFKVTKNQEEISGYQIVMEENNMFEIKMLVEEIYALKPFCVWYMGNLTLFADLFCNLTTVLAMPFTNGYAISEAPFMLSYLNSHSDEIEIMEHYLSERNQIPVPYTLEVPFKLSEKKYGREEFQLKAEAFVIAIVGNRLDSEITEEFIAFLKRLMILEPRVVLAFIGPYAGEKFQTDPLFDDRIKCFGFQEDLIGILGIMDLFLNPPRQGGATGAVYSMAVGVPAVTLEHCDVANFVDAEDICANEEDMLQHIIKYINDPIYYKRRSGDVTKILEKMNQDSFIKNTEQMLNHVNSLIELQEKDSKLF